MGKQEQREGEEESLRISKPKRLHIIGKLSAGTAKRKDYGS